MGAFAFGLCLCTACSLTELQSVISGPVSAYALRFAQPLQQSRSLHRPAASNRAVLRTCFACVQGNLEAEQAEARKREKAERKKKQEEERKQAEEEAAAAKARASS